MDIEKLYAYQDGKARSRKVNGVAFLPILYQLMGWKEDLRRQKMDRLHKAVLFLLIQNIMNSPIIVQNRVGISEKMRRPPSFIRITFTHMNTYLR